MIHLTKSAKRDNICKLCLCMLEEHNYLIITSSQVPKLRYSAHARKYKPVFYCTESLKHDDIVFINGR